VKIQARKHRKSNSPTTIFLVLSAAIHLIVFTAFTLAPRPSPPAAPATVEVEYVTPPTELTPAPNDKHKQTRRAVKPDRDQIVDQLKKINDELDQKTRFLSAHNQKVIEQTRASKSGKFSNSAKSGKQHEGRKDGAKDSTTLADTAAKEAEAGDVKNLRQLAPKFSLNPGPQNNPNDETGDPSQTDDYLKDVKTGMQTLLSTREFVYYSYYSRIKDALRQHWEPTVREKVKIIYRGGRDLASSKDRVTQVLVTLDSRGELIKVEVLTQSGVEALDDAAVQSFREAAPFPNPPKGMVEADGTIKIRWDFVLEA